jgi:Protein of unknown function (DUF3011)/Ricin-type beta-trefoil lectin domain-like
MSSSFRFRWSLTAAVALCLPSILCAQGGFSGPGQYEITNIKSGKVLDLDRNNQTSVIQFSSRNTDNQVWVVMAADSGYYYLRNAMNGYALDAPVNRDSAPVRGVPFSGGQSQQWRIENGKDGNALIVNRLGRSLDVPGGTSRDGANVQIYEKNGDSNQRFTFRAVSGNFGGAWMGTGGPAQKVTCSSDSGRRVHCNADTSGSVTMVRQISGSPCRQNETWGYDSNGIWVDRGCRAEFEVRPRSDTWGGAGSSGNRITCSSDSGNRVYCNADTSGSVRMVRQISGSPCRQNETWGYDSSGIWVDRGCRAEFEITPRSDTWGSVASSRTRITCSSNSGNRVHCAADTSWGARMVRQISGSPCRLNETWGYDSSGIWVDRGCRAEFEVGR